MLQLDKQKKGLRKKTIAIATYGIVVENLLGCSQDDKPVYMKQGPEEKTRTLFVVTANSNKSIMAI